MPEPSDKAATAKKLTRTLTELAALFVPRIRPFGEDAGSTTDKFRKRVRYAVRRGDLETAGPDIYYLPHVVAWARKKWPGKVDDLLAEQTTTTSTSLGVGDNMLMSVVPGDLPRCQQALQDAQRDIYALQAELKSAHAKIARLTPLAERYAEICQGNRESARLARKDRW